MSGGKVGRRQPQKQGHNTSGISQRLLDAQAQARPPVVPPLPLSPLSVSPPLSEDDDAEYSSDTSDVPPLNHDGSQEGDSQDESTYKTPPQSPLGSNSESPEDSTSSINRHSKKSNKPAKNPSKDNIPEEDLLAVAELYNSSAEKHKAAVLAANTEYNSAKEMRDNILATRPVQLGQDKAESLLLEKKFLARTLKKQPHDTTNAAKVRKPSSARNRSNRPTILEASPRPLATTPGILQPAEKIISETVQEVERARLEKVVKQARLSAIQSAEFIVPKSVEIFKLLVSQMLKEPIQNVQDKIDILDALNLGLPSTHEKIIQEQLALLRRAEQTTPDGPAPATGSINNSDTAVDFATVSANQTTSLNLQQSSSIATKLLYAIKSLFIAIGEFFATCIPKNSDATRITKLHNSIKGS